MTSHRPSSIRLALRTAAGSCGLLALAVFGNGIWVDFANNRELDQGIRTNNLAQVNAVLDRGANLYGESYTGSLLFHQAALYHRKEIVESFLARGADCNRRGAYGSTALMYAAHRDGDLSLLQLLLKRGAQVDARRSDGATALFFAAKRGDVRAVQLLLAAGANPHQTDHRAETPLIFAAEGGHLRVVQLLVAAGTKPAARDNHGFTACQRAKRMGHVAVARWLKDLSGKN